jgi:hypothetical protein
VRDGDHCGPPSPLGLATCHKLETVGRSTIPIGPR